MVLFNYATKEITAKIVYYGPGLCGKTTNLQFIYDSLPSNSKSKMLSLATKTDRTLFFDFLPLDLGKIRGMRTKLQLYTVPGQVYYNSTRQLVLKGADGIVFVADSQDFALDANLESLQNLEDNLKRQGVRIREIPVVMQYNKRDLPNTLPVAEMDAEINKTLHGPSFESVATTGIGVEETLKGITQLVLAHLIKKYNLEGSEPIDRDLQILNAPAERAPGADTLWEDADDEPAPRPAAKQPAPPSRPPAAKPSAGFVIDDDADDSIPLVATELVGSKPAPPPPPPSAPPLPPLDENPFEDVTDYYATSGPPAGLPDLMTEVPMASIEIPLPAGILDSLPQLEAQTATVAAPPSERRATDGLVKEVSIPLNLSLDEIRNHRRLRLKITLDVNLLP
jgi:signal recognition particle receptor subunit beta